MMTESIELSVPPRGLFAVAALMAGAAAALHALVITTASAPRLLVPVLVAGCCLVLGVGTTVKVRVTAVFIGQRYFFWWAPSTAIPAGSRVVASKATAWLDRVLQVVLSAPPPIAIRGPDGVLIDGIPLLFVCNLSQGEYQSLLERLQLLLDSRAPAA